MDTNTVDEESKTTPEESDVEDKIEDVNKKAVQIRRGKKLKDFIVQMIQLFIGASIASIGLEIFLIPNEVIDGGVVGLSIMARYVTGMPLGVFLVVFNIPFIYLAYKHIGKHFVISIHQNHRKDQHQHNIARCSQVGNIIRNAHITKCKHKCYCLFETKSPPII